MASKVDVANIALTNLGEAKIDSIDDTNERAQLCRQRIDDVLDTVLRDHPWNCVTERMLLPQSTDTPAWGFTYKYAIPSDCLRILILDDPTIIYKVESGFILTDAGTVKIKYIKRPNSWAVLDPTLIYALGIKLAEEVAEPLTAKTALKAEMKQKYMLALANARSIDATEGSPERVETYSWIDNRLADKAEDYRKIEGESSGYTANW